MTRPLVSLTTDFGLTDPSVGICKGVILSIVPDAQIVDVSHGIARQSIIQGASLLQVALPYLPVGVHMAVVDPGVGTGRRPVALRTGRGDFLVGPDNGLLIPAAGSLGGVAACHELAAERYRHSPVSATFHGRDVFAPAAGHLAAGVAIEDLGPAVDPTSLVRLDLPAAIVGEGTLRATVVGIDAFGSAQLLADRAELESAVGPLTPGDRLLLVSEDPGRSIEGSGRSIEATWHRTYGEAAEGEPIVLVDSYGRLAVAVNMGSAAAALGLAVGKRIEVRKR